jgi:hypothetical protein
MKKPFGDEQMRGLNVEEDWGSCSGWVTTYNK